VSRYYLVRYLVVSAFVLVNILHLFTKDLTEGAVNELATGIVYSSLDIC
jgi:hypothetical protein